MTYLFKYPYSSCMDNVETGLFQSLLTLQVWDTCCVVEDTWVLEGKPRLLRCSGKHKSIHMSVPKQTWKSLLYTFNQVDRMVKPQDSKYLTVLFIDSIASIKNSRVSWYCRCICGKIVSITAKHISSGHSKSCGCRKQQIRRETNVNKYGVPNSSKAVEVKAKAKRNLEYKGMVPVEELAALNKKGLTCVEIAEQCNYANNSAVTSRLIRGGYEIDNHHTVCESVELLHNMNVEQKMTCSEIAKRLGYNHASGVRNRLIAAGYKPATYNTEISVPHRLIIEYLDSCSIEYEANNRTILEGKELDIFIPEHGVAVEINGIYWHSESRGKDVGYHLNKTVQCAEKGIQLLHFWDFEILNNLDLVVSMIASKCGLTKRYYARKLTVVNVSTDISNKFLTKNHIQGSVGASVKLGLETNEGELLCLLTIGKARYTKADWEILRFANVSGTTVVGGFSRLLKHFTRSNQGTIVSYANRRFSSGKVYERLGFTRSHASAPCYYYFHKSNTETLYHRSKFMKHKLSNILADFDPDLSEVENMNNNGYDRVFDCGTLVYTLEDQL